MYLIRFLPRAAAVAVVLLASRPAAAQERPRDLDDLLIKYRCAVYDRLAQIHATRPTPQHRFLVVSLTSKPEDYVQCLFENGDRTMLCETASGYYGHVPRDMWLPKPAVAALARLGYSTDDSAGNFQIEFKVPNPPDLARIADFMLTSLNAGFGADGGTDLSFSAPYAPHASSDCTPTG